MTPLLSPGIGGQAPPAPAPVMTPVTTPGWAGAYAQRPPADGAWARLGETWRVLCSLARPCRPRPLPPALAERLARACRRAEALDAAALATAAARLARKLRLPADAAAAERAQVHALALAAQAMWLARGLRPYDTQLQAAWLMLSGRLAEMATGEGKTLAAALAAAALALRGHPVHLLTANDYLVTRDAAALAGFYRLLGLGCTAVTAATPHGERAAAWGHAVVYTTAREVAFDYLRDHLALAGERDPLLVRARAIEAGGRGPALQGLHAALLDEADSILLDEAVVPLIIARQQAVGAAERWSWQQADAIAGRLLRPRDYRLLEPERRAELSDAGRERVAAAVQALCDPAQPLAPALLAPRRRAFELVEAALAARHLYRRDRDYLVTPAEGQSRGAIELLDSVTGRIAEGRQWQGALQVMVEIKEGLEPGRPSTPAAQITYQRFFPRYHLLGGMSGTLREARHELARVYGAPVAAVPLVRPARRRWLGLQVFVDAAGRWAAVLAAVRREQGAGRPVLVGTDSVADALHCSALLQAADIPHQLLTARQDADEAKRVALAGRAGQVTVTTNMAGRGTDIVPDAAALAAGGLHVVAALRNRSRRIDRQLVGRAARQGDPGSAEAIVALDEGLPGLLLPRWLRRLARRWARPVATLPGTPARLPAALGAALLALAQRRAEQADRLGRARLRGADRAAARWVGFGGALE